MTLPETIKIYIEESTGINIYGSEQLQGGSINRSVRLRTDRGLLFLKWNLTAPADMFEKEAEGLNLLRKADTGLEIPAVLSWHSGSAHMPGFLLMDYIEPAGETDNGSALFGRQLANLHRCTNDRFGLSHDNYIGYLHQSNRSHTDWAEFFAIERIEPQLKLSTDSGVIDRSVVKHWLRLEHDLPDFFPECEPALLHGDLWSGNYFFDAENRPVLIDPAVYFGHPEMELAFTKMFGGFSQSFYDAYCEQAPFEVGFQERIPVYNLYPLLVHTNLFGGSYANQAESFLKQF